MIRKCTKQDFDRIPEIINNAARACRGVIPEDCRHEPYMTAGEIREQITFRLNTKTDTPRQQGCGKCAHSIQNPC